MDDDEAEPGLVTLPPRPPRPWWVHWAADSLAVFLVIIPFTFHELDLAVFVAATAGAVLMSVTQWLERRHLAEREERAKG